MKKRTVKFTKNTSVVPGFAHLPGLEIEISYRATCELVWDDEGREESNDLLELQVFVNGVAQPFEWPIDSPTDKGGWLFHAFMRECARNAIYMQQMSHALAEVGYPPKSFVE